MGVKVKQRWLPQAKVWSQELLAPPVGGGDLVLSALPGTLATNWNRNLCIIKND